MASFASVQKKVNRFQLSSSLSLVLRDIKLPSQNFAAKPAFQWLLAVFNHENDIGLYGLLTQKFLPAFALERNEKSRAANPAFFNARSSGFPAAFLAFFWFSRDLRSDARTRAGNFRACLHLPL